MEIFEIESSLTGMFTVEHGAKHPFIFLCLEQYYMYFSIRRLTLLKNSLLSAIRYLKEHRREWRTSQLSPSPSEKISIRVSRDGKQSFITPVRTYGGLPFYVSLTPEEANRFVRDIKDVLVAIRLKSK